MRERNKLKKCRSLNTNKKIWYNFDIFGIKGQPDIYLLQECINWTGFWMVVVVTWWQLILHWLTFTATNNHRQSPGWQISSQNGWIDLREQFSSKTLFSLYEKTAKPNF